MHALESARVPFAIYQSFGESYSQEASEIAEALSGIRVSKFSSIYLSGTGTIVGQEVLALYNRTHAADWDQEEGQPPSTLTFENAKAFAQMIPDSWPLPDLDVDRDGDIRFEWVLAQRLRLSIAIGPDAEVPYSWIIQEERGFSVGYLGAGVPAGIEAQMDRLLEAERQLARQTTVA